MKRIVVIGAGIGGLTAAAVLARAGLDVTVLEAQVYPGGCASTFYHQGFRFDSGATLAAGFYPGGPMDRIAAALGIRGWNEKPLDQAMVVHLPGGTQVSLWGDERRWEERARAFGPEAEVFWRWQERTADVLWNFALRLPPWPPQSLDDLLRLAEHGLALSWNGDRRKPGAGGVPVLTQLLRDSLRPVSAHLDGHNDRLRLFADAQLLISSQATSASANALYGASALDLPRRGVVHLPGGIGTIAEILARCIRQNGGRVIYRREVTEILFQGGKISGVNTRQGERYPADLVIANLPPLNIARLIPEDRGPDLEKLAQRLNKLHPPDGWGAYMVYLGVDAGQLPANIPHHHQVVVKEPLGEANSCFISFSPEFDRSRAPQGQRAVTLSTHTRLSPWWRLYEQDRPGYEERKGEYTERMLSAAEIAIPGLRKAATLTLPGTPVTFQRFTRRIQGWVGGYPQTSLLRANGPSLAPGLWMVGDSVFPGQSIPAVALGGLRVAREVLLKQTKERNGKDENWNRWERFGRLDGSVCHGHARRWAGDHPGRSQPAARSS